MVEPVDDPERILREHRATQRVEAIRNRPQPVDIEINESNERNRASEDTPNVSPNDPPGYIRGPLKYLRIVTEAEESQSDLMDEEKKYDTIGERLMAPLPESPAAAEALTVEEHDVIDLPAESEDPL